MKPAAINATEFAALIASSEVAVAAAMSLFAWSDSAVRENVEYRCNVCESSDRVVARVYGELEIVGRMAWNGKNFVAL